MIICFIIGFLLGALVWPCYATWQYLSYVRNRRQYFLDNKEELLKIKRERLAQAQGTSGKS